ncbi:MAG: pyridoxamine 5'-phosphate oxidase family protein [Oscillospiraceae bacterium]|nr:pyridoxamine 5'-phosphate oxidase family protein [Oscillospiraceae bacterium]
MQEVYEFLKAAGTYYLATCDEGQPRVRPFGTVNLFDGKLYIQTGRVKAVSHQLHANPHIEICAMLPGKWLRVEASAVLDDRRDARVSMLDAYPALQKMYSPDDGNTEVWYLRNATATFYAFGEQPRSVSF